MAAVEATLRPTGTLVGPGDGSVRRPARYTLVSVLCGLLAQGGLALAYGVFGWGSAAAVLFSLAVSIIPSYWGSRTYVWSGLGRHNRRVEMVAFLVIAVIGSCTAMVMATATELVGRSFTSDRDLLTLWINAGSILATVVVWVSRYFVLDRFLFAARR